MDDVELRKLRRENRKLRNVLENLAKSVHRFMRCLDETMKEPSTAERGRVIAKLCNDLELFNDQVRHFVLGIDLKTGKKIRGK